MTQHTDLIERLRKLALAATPGPWESISRDQYWGEVEGEVHGADGEEVRGAEHVKPLSSQETMRGQAWLRDTDYIACAHPQNILGLLDALEAQAREIAELKAQLAATAKNAFEAMPHDIPQRMKDAICEETGWSGSLVSRAYTELRKTFTGEPYKANEDLDAALLEIERLRKDAALVAARERERIAAMAQCTVWAGREFADRIRALNTEGDGNDRP